MVGVGRDLTSQPKTQNPSSLLPACNWGGFGDTSKASQSDAAQEQSCAPQPSSAGAFAVASLTASLPCSGVKNAAFGPAGEQRFSRDLGDARRGAGSRVKALGNALKGAALLGRQRPGRVLRSGLPLCGVQPSLPRRQRC